MEENNTIKHNNKELCNISTNEDNEKTHRGK